MSQIAKMENEMLITKSAVSQFKIKDKFHPSTSKYYYCGGMITTPYLHINFTNSGINGVMSFPTKNLQKEELQEAFNAIKYVTTWLKRKKLLRYDLTDRVKNRLDKIMKILKKERGAVGVAPLFITYPIPVPFPNTLKVGVKPRGYLSGVVMSENLISRFGARAFIYWPCEKTKRHTGYVRVIGRPSEVKKMVKILKKEATMTKVFKD